MKCVWITGVATFLAVVISLALLPCLVPAPIHDASLRTVDAAVTPLQSTDIQLAAGKTGTLPNTMVFTANKPQVVGRLYLNEQGKLAFEGDIDASAQAFVEAVNQKMATQK
ncbi:MAG: hypothetical protein RBU21_07970 [FCB group bacterium]|jgi:hypothetical protein|nr:hypothetical protein [FCB group bacterium]